MCKERREGVGIIQGPYDVQKPWNKGAGAGGRGEERPVGWSFGYGRGVFGTSGHASGEAGVR